MSIHVTQSHLRCNAITQKNVLSMYGHTHLGVHAPKITPWLLQWSPVVTCDVTPPPPAQVATIKEMNGDLPLAALFAGISGLGSAG